jgi:sulfofructose kinase
MPYLYNRTMDLPVISPSSCLFDAVGIGLNAIDDVIVVPYFPGLDSKVEYISRTRYFGGPAASTMVSLSRLGLKSRYIGRVGADDLGRLQGNRMIDKSGS